MSSNAVIVELSARHYQMLQKMAQETGKAPEALARDILEPALQQATQAAPLDRESVRRVLRAAGRTRSLGPELRQRIIPGVTLEEVQKSLADTGVKPLSQVILEQRGPRA
jgi:hypothetical protein